MRRVRFTLDGDGPHAGMMRFGLVGDGEIEFIAISITRSEVAGCKTVEVFTEDGQVFAAPIEEIVVDESRFDAEEGTVSGYLRESVRSFVYE